MKARDAVRIVMTAAQRDSGSKRLDEPREAVARWCFTSHAMHEAVDVLGLALVLSLYEVCRYD